MNLIKAIVVLLFLLICNLSKAQDFSDSPLFYLSGDTIKAKPGLSLPGVTSSIGAISGEDVTTALGYIPATSARTINGHPLTSNVTITKADLNIDTTAYLNATNINSGTLSNSRLASSVYTTSTLDTSTISFLNQFNNFSADVDIATKLESANYLNKAPTDLRDSVMDCSLNNLYTLYLTNNVNLYLTNMPDNKWISVWITNEVDYTINWTNTILWPSSTPPTLTTGGKTDVYSFIQINSVIYGSVVQNY